MRNTYSIYSTLLFANDPTALMKKGVMEIKKWKWKWKWEKGRKRKKKKEKTEKERIKKMKRGNGM